MKKSYYCEKLEKTLHFLPNEVKLCNTCNEGLILEFNNLSNIDKAQLLKEKMKYIEQFKKGTIPSPCVDCNEYKEAEKSSLFEKIFSNKKHNKINHIIVDHFVQCELDCVYCSQTVFRKDILQNYELLPIIKELYNNNLFDKDLCVDFQGGNLTLLKEFESLIHEFEKYGCKNYVFYVNGYKITPEFLRVASNGSSSVCISLDSGSKETYEKIKGTDAFEIVIKNIQDLANTPNIKLKLKYIIVNGLNDNLDELMKFLQFAKSLQKIDCIILEMDFRNTIFQKENRFNVPQHYYELFKTAENYCSENNLPYYVFEHTKSVLDVGYCD